MAYSEFKVPVHREVKFAGLKNHRLLYGGKGEKNQGVTFLG